MSSNEAETQAQAGETTDEYSPPAHWRRYQKDGITVRVPAEPPKLTPQAARALLAIIIELSDREREKRPLT